MDSEGLIHDLLKKKLAYPYEKFNFENMSQLLNLSKEDYLSTQCHPCDDDIERPFLYHHHTGDIVLTNSLLWLGLVIETYFRD